MAIVSAGVLKSYFEAGDTPTAAEFVDLVDSTINSDIAQSIASAASAGQTGLIEVTDASSVTFLAPGTAGRAVVTASTPASIRTILSAASAGDAIFLTETFASVRTAIGAASTSAATTTSAGVIQIATTAEAIAGTNETKAMTPATQAAVGGGGSLTLETPQSAAGTSVDFTGLSSDAKRIAVNFIGVSTNGNSNVLVQLGDSGGVEATGYLGSSTLLDSGVTSLNFTIGFGLVAGAASSVRHGSITLELENASDNTWSAHGNFGLSNAAGTITTGGSKSLSATLDRVRITTVNGTDSFDAGEINLSIQT